jgi:hypothetical protein
MCRSNRTRKILAVLLFAAVAALVSAGGYPPASSVQDARTIGKNNVRVTGYWFGLKDTGDGGDKIANVYGGLLGIGTGERTEIQFRFDHFDFVDSDRAYDFVSVAPKFDLAKGRLALLVPFGLYADDGLKGDSFQIHPGVLGTLRAGRFLEVNVAARLMFPFDQDYLTWFNLGVGIGLSTDLDRWAILPELGCSICLDESSIDPVFSYGIALLFPTGR